MCERELETRTQLQHIDTHSYGHQRCVFLVLLMLNRRPGGSAFCWLVLIPASSLYLIWSPTQSGVPRTPSAGWWLSLPHLVSNSSDLRPTYFLYPPSYIIFQSPTQSLEWYVRSSSSGNNCHCSSQITLFRCVSLWVYHGILPYPIFSAKPSYAISSQNCHQNRSPSFPAHHFGNACLAQVEGQYTTEGKPLLVVTSLLVIAFKVLIRNGT